MEMPARARGGDRPAGRGARQDDEPGETNLRGNVQVNASRGRRLGLRPRQSRAGHRDPAAARRRGGQERRRRGAAARRRRDAGHRGGDGLPPALAGPLAAGSGAGAGPGAGGGGPAAGCRCARPPSRAARAVSELRRRQGRLAIGREAEGAAAGEPAEPPRRGDPARRALAARSRLQRGLLLRRGGAPGRAPGWSASTATTAFWSGRGSGFRRWNTATARGGTSPTRPST